MAATFAAAVDARVCGIVIQSPVGAAGHARDRQRQASSLAALRPHTVRAAATHRNEKAALRREEPSALSAVTDPPSFVVCQCNSFPPF